MNECRPKRIAGGLRAAAWFCGAAALTGCDGDPAPTSPTPIVTYENIAGIWTGQVGGVTQGVTLDGTITLTLQQSGGVQFAGALSGGYSVLATLTNPTQQSSLQGSVMLTGTVAPGTDPAVNFSTTSVQCPALPSENWSGSYGSRDSALTITGTAHVITSTCVVVLTYPQTIRLTRQAGS
jgi:hypothetical protein